VLLGDSETLEIVLYHAQVLLHIFHLVCRYLLTNQQQQQHRSVTDLMPMIGARFYTQLDAIQIRSDVLENEVCREMENGRICRLLVKLGTVNERPE
jgi:PAB-dependent poly(A)-specific ribonuclease subunit 3